MEWGIPFLTMNYMVIDYQAGHFQLAPAYRQDFGAAGGALIKPLCTGVAPSVTSSTALPTTSVVSDGNGTASTSSQVKRHHTNVGAIAGGVVGGVIGIAIIAVLGYLLLRQRRRTRQAERQAANATTTQEITPTQATGGAGAEHLSTYTATSPTEYTELSSQGLEGKAHHSVNQWLSQDRDVDEVRIDYLVILFASVSSELTPLSLL